MYEVTSRTIREQYLLRPCPESKEMILGIIGRALALFPLVRLYAFVYLSNHFHMLLSADDGESVAGFMGYVNGNIARKLGKIRGSRGKVWGGRIRPIRIVDEGALLERFHYVLEQGCKEGLVASPREWPGVSAVPGLLGDMEMEGTWIDWDARSKELRRTGAVTPGAHEIVYPIPLSPLPIWAALSPDELRCKHEEIIREIERATAAENRRLRRRPIGVAAILAQDPFGRPDEPKASRAPFCHATDAMAHARYQAAYDSFVECYWSAADETRSAGPAAAFPEHAFPCPARFTRSARGRPDNGRVTPSL